MSKKQLKAKKNAKPATKAAIPAAQDTRPKGKSVITRDYKKSVKGKPQTELQLELTEAMLSDERALEQVAKENSVPFNWVHLNKGMQRMNLGNVLQGKLNRFERVTVLGRVIGTPAAPMALAA